MSEQEFMDPYEAGLTYQETFELGRQQGRLEGLEEGREEDRLENARRHAARTLARRFATELPGRLAAAIQQCATPDLLYEVEGLAFEDPSPAALEERALALLTSEP